VPINSRTIVYTKHLFPFVMPHGCVIFLSDGTAESIYTVAMLCDWLFIPSLMKDGTNVAYNEPIHKKTHTNHMLDIK
jgi:hypothetical protein